MSRSRAKFAGVLPPTTTPNFRIDRKSLWQPNQRTQSATLTLNADDDPIAPDNSGTRLYHFQTDGNAYLRQLWSPAMSWSPNATPGNADTFCFKALIKPYEVHGRRLLYSAKGKLKSGGIFVDIFDGKLRIGWFDTVQKREVWVESNVAMFDPHHWHYVYVRKRFPSTALGSGSWTDTIFSLTSGSSNDVALVRRFRRVATSIHQQKPWDYKGALTGHAGTREFVGLTTDLQYSVAGAAATGLVSRNDRTFTGNAAGQVTASAAIFTPDMLGMYFGVGSNALIGRYYVISTYTSSTVVNCVDPVSGAAVDLSGVVAGTTGGVYLGARLIKSDGYATASDPDQTSYDVELCGSHLSSDPESGVLPFVGECSGFAYTNATGALPNLFEAAGGDAADDGTDEFNNVEIYANNAQGPDELHVTSNCFTAVHTQTYAGIAPDSTVPNEKLEVAVDSTSAATATPLHWKYLAEPIDLSRPRRVRVAFYDPEQAQVSNPSPELLIQPGGDDASNPSGSASIVLTDLPVSRDAGPIETWVYVTEADGATYRKVAEVPSGTSSVAIAKTEKEIGRGELLEFDNNPPPQCDVLEAAGGCLAFGNLRRYVNDDGEPQDLANAVVFSKPFQPVTAPGANLFPVMGGSIPGVTGMRELNGRLVIAKADALFRATLRQGAAAIEDISNKIGCRSGASMIVLDEQLWFVADAGPYVYPGSGVPQPAYEQVQVLFASGLDRRSLPRAVAALNRQRNQIVVTLREAGALYTAMRLSMESKPEIEHASPSRYDGINLTALSEYRDASGQVAEFVGGTEEGFVAWLDRSDTPHSLIGSTAAIYGATALTLDVGSSSTKLVVIGTLDVSFGGPRAVRVRWGSTSEAVVLFAEGQNLHLDRPLSAVPTAGTALTLAATKRRWKTRWLDFGVLFGRKQMRYLDIINTVKSSGLINCNASLDFSATVQTLIPNTEVPQSLADQTLSFTRFDIGHLEARYFQFTFESESDFEIVALAFRMSDTDAY